MDVDEDNLVIIEDGLSVVFGQKIDNVDADPLELQSMEEHEDSTPSDKLGLVKFTMDNPSHQNVKKWVGSSAEEMSGYLATMSLQNTRQN